jgi:hypothetical protein
LETRFEKPFRIKLIWWFQIYVNRVSKKSHAYTYLYRNLGAHPTHLYMFQCHHICCTKLHLPLQKSGSSSDLSLHVSISSHMLYQATLTFTEIWVLIRPIFTCFNTITYVVPSYTLLLIFTFSSVVRTFVIYKCKHTCACINKTLVYILNNRC